MLLLLLGTSGNGNGGRLLLIGERVKLVVGWNKDLCLRGGRGWLEFGGGRGLAAVLAARGTPVFAELGHYPATDGRWGHWRLQRCLGRPLLCDLGRVQKLWRTGNLVVAVVLGAGAALSILALVRGQLAVGRLLLGLCDGEETGRPCGVDDDGRGCGRVAAVVGVLDGGLGE
jgi:hypothetical protein